VQDASGKVFNVIKWTAPGKLQLCKPDGTVIAERSTVAGADIPFQLVVSQSQGK
jgi:hypothetical protein